MTADVYIITSLLREKHALVQERDQLRATLTAVDERITAHLQDGLSWAACLALRDVQTFTKTEK